MSAVHSRGRRGANLLIPGGSGPQRVDVVPHLDGIVAAVPYFLLSNAASLTGCRILQLGNDCSIHPSRPLGSVLASFSSGRVGLFISSGFAVLGTLFRFASGILLGVEGLKNEHELPETGDYFIPFTSHLGCGCGKRCARAEGPMQIQAAAPPGLAPAAALSPDI